MDSQRRSGNETIYFDKLHNIQVDSGILEVIFNAILLEYRRKDAEYRQSASNNVEYLLNRFKPFQAKIDPRAAKRVKHILTQLQKYFHDPDKARINKLGAYMFVIFISSPPNKMKGSNNTGDLLKCFKQHQVKFDSLNAESAEYALTKLQKYDHNRNTARINELDAYIFRAFVNYRLNQ